MSFQRIHGPVFAWVGGDGPVDPGYGVGEGSPDNSLPGEPGSPSHPIVLPPLPPDLHPEHPIYVPAGRPSHPIYIPVTPEHPIALPPGEIWPPLPPDVGIGDKTLILIYVVGVGYRWFYTDGPSVYPPVPTPK